MDLKFNVGDTVVYSYHEEENPPDAEAYDGVAFTVTEVDEEDDNLPYYIRVFHNHFGMWVHENNVRSPYDDSNIEIIDVNESVLL